MTDKAAALKSKEMISNMGQPVCNLYRHDIARQVAKAIALCNASLNPSLKW